MNKDQKIRAVQFRLSGVMVEDRVRILKKLRAITRQASKGGGDQEFFSQLRAIEKRIDAAVRRKETRTARRPTLFYPQDLPILSKREVIVRAIQRNPVIIVSGDTGSGKSTQIPKMCLEAGRGIEGKIGCTQPRRIAAATISRRIAQELGEEIGKSVGFKIRFTDRASPSGYIKIMTDGILLAETQGDPLLSEYDTLIIDEAHERSLNIDFLLGIVKNLLPLRKDLRVIITSATIDTEKFSNAFDGAPVIEVKGRMYPVEVQYLPLDRDLEDTGELTYVEMAVQAVEKLQKKGRSGDILVFMPTEQDIRETCALLETKPSPETTVLPLFARLSALQQQRIFSPFSGRKIVVATNVAETSLTIPGIKYVIDTGLARIPRYLPHSRTTSLPVSPISKSSADQRKGRCGRVENGICIRLYSEEDYACRPEFTVPEILRSNLAAVILQMLSLDLGHIESFPFVDSPNPKSVKDGFALLVELGAIERNGKTISLTEKGRVMARMPMDPQISRMILEAGKEGCVPEVTIIASALSIQDPRERPSEKADQADQMHAPLRDPASDFITLLNIWNHYHRSWDALKTQSRMRRFCKEHFLSYTRMREWRDIHEQVNMLLKDHGMAILPVKNEKSSDPLYVRIHRSILSGYLSNIAMKKDKNIYQAARGREVMIFPGSALFNKGFPWVVAAEMVKTSRLFARTVGMVDPQWLEALGGKLCRSSYSEPHWEKNRGEVRAYEQVTLYGLVIVSRRPISYGVINPVESHRIFIQRALVEGEMRDAFSFLTHNRELIEKIVNLENKVRRRDILVSGQALADFYSGRLPSVYDTRTLKKVIKERGGDEFLKMKEEDLLVSWPDENVLAEFPDHLAVGEKSFPLTYKFVPGKEEDGVSISIPAPLASRFPAERLDWMVPGLFKEKIVMLIKGLPKRYRKQLVPVSRTAEVIAAEMPQTDQPLVTSLSSFIYRRFGADIPASVWPVDEIPAHLKMRVAILDQKGQVVESGRELKALRQIELPEDPGEKGMEAWKKARQEWERTGMTAWNFDRLPEQISLGSNQLAFPALVAEEGSVGIRLFTNAEKAHEEHKRGVKALYVLALRKDLKYLRRIMILPPEMAEPAKYFGGAIAFEKALYDTLIQHLFSLNVRTREDFFAHVDKVKPALMDQARGLIEQVGKVLLAFQQTRFTLHSIERANRFNKGILALCHEIRRDMENLVPKNFPELYSLDRLMHLPRYLKSMEMRAERGANDLEKDRRKAAEVAEFVKAWGEINKTLSPYASQEKREALQELRWMLEELKVSLFAQELKTPHPISRKRLANKIHEIERMA